MKTSPLPLPKARLGLSCACLLLCLSAGLSRADASSAVAGPKLELLQQNPITPATQPEVVAWGDNFFGQTKVPVSLAGVTAIAAGGNHTLALKSDGSVVAWGSNSSGLNSLPTGLSGVVAIAAGASHSVALKQDGTVVAWGFNGYGQTKVPAGLGGVVAISAGNYHTVVLKQDGTVVAWGAENMHDGQATVPAGLSGVAAIAAGGQHTAALKQDGSVIVWGRNNLGQGRVPEGLSGVVAIAAGYVHTVALKSDGTIVAWGHNSSGQTNVPVGLTGVVAIAAGNYQTMVLKQDGTVLAWGQDPGSYNSDLMPPPGLNSVEAIAAGGAHRVALTRSVEFGSASLTAFNERTSQIRNAGGVGLSSLSATISGDDAASFAIMGAPLPDSLAIGGSAELLIRFSPQHYGKHSAILRVTSSDPAMRPFNVLLTGTSPPPPAPKLELRDATNQEISNPSLGNKVVAWGLNISGLLRGQTDVPKGLSGVVAVSAGAFHSVALKQDGSVVEWGELFGRKPSVPAGLSGVVAIAAGFDHTTALKQDGTVVDWGRITGRSNRFPEGLVGVVAISSGEHFSAALKHDGTVVAWGENDTGQCNVPRGLSGVTAIASNRRHTMALKQDGSVVGWGSRYPFGDPGYGQPYVPAGLRGLTAIATGDNETVALKQDGSVVAWAMDPGYRPYVPPGLSNVEAIAMGSFQALALKQDGTVVGWYNQLKVPRGLRGVAAIAAGDYHNVAMVEAPGEFGERPLNTHRAHSFNLANAGQLPLQTSVVIEGPDADQFSFLAPTPTAIAVNGSRELLYQFTPSRMGPLHATLKITSNDPVTPVYIIDLTGAGIYASNTATKPGAKGSSLTYGPPVADRATGAILQKITFTNASGFALNGLLLVVSHLTPGVTLQSSSATDKFGTVDVIYSKPIAKGETVSLTLTYHDPLRRTNLQPIINAKSLAEPEPREGPGDGALVPLQSVRDSANGPILQWNAVAKKTYVVEYSDDAGKTWYSAVHRLVAGSSRLLWTDRGQPETWDKPVNKAGRLYRVKSEK